ncbi:hypothetical protein DL98DRAFT_660192, partial [Cadophora sp. DSE1049]
MAQPRETYQYNTMPTQTSFRVLELLPGEECDPVSCLLLHVGWSTPLQYEAIPYAWGDASDPEPIICQGRELKVTRNLHNGLCHFRFRDRSRILWVDAICINQSDIPERSSQVTQMLRIYQTAKAVLVWLGPDSQEHYAQFAINSIRILSDFLCQKVGISVADLCSVSDIYQDVVSKNRTTLPLPNTCESRTEVMWKALVWFYSHPYFTRVWAVQEINANKARSLHCGRASVEWDRVALVAGYIIMETAFSKSFGFTSAKCWWAAIMTTEHPRDHIYGLRGLMKFSDGAGLLDPDYGKSEIEVYRDSVEAGLVHFQNTDVLLYRTGNETPSWIPRWNRPMLSGFVVDHIKYATSYDESIFGNATIKSDEGRIEVKQVWQRILTTMEKSRLQTPFGASVLTAAATSFSFRLEEKSDPANEFHLLHNFVAYLKMVLDEETFNKYIPPDVREESKHADGLEFGKPVWDFTYPESSFFLAESGLVGCCVSTARPEDIVYIALGSKYPFVLRPDGDCFLLRGFTYVYGIMRGERGGSEEQIFRIR